MDYFTPEQKKVAISKQAETDIGSILEDLVVAAWLVYGLTHSKPKTEPHQIAVGVINTFKLHEFGWHESPLIPSRLMLEGKDVTLDERIDEYRALAREHRDELRPNLVILLVCVYHLSRHTPQDLMYQWVLRALKRHRISEDVYTSQAGAANLVLPDSDKVQ